MPGKIFALPGMGADSRMYPAPWTTLPAFQALDWKASFACQSLESAAARLCEIHGISDGDTVVGTSLGGIVACEIARLRHLSHLVLIGSATSRSEVNGLLLKLVPLAGLAPVEWLRLSARHVPSDLARMFAASDAAFIRAMCAAIADWRGHEPSDTAILRIHGRRDRIINHPNQVDHWIAGGHLITMTHPTECVNLVQRHLATS